jgi:4'-phosphopantetheinyl transferase
LGDVPFHRSSLHERCHLPLNAVHLWKSSLIVSNDQYQALWQILEESEQAWATRFRTLQQRRRFVACRGQLRLLLARYLAVSPASIRFIRDAYGRPRLSSAEPDQGLVFNVSHTDDHAAYAFAYDRTLGVDIQSWRNVDNLDGLVERCFAPVEKAVWRNAPTGARERLFFSFWCLKEAFVKAVGVGISFGLSRCALMPGENPRLLAIPESCGAIDEWTLVNIHFNERLSGALAIKTRSPEVVVREELVFAPHLLEI